VLGYVTLIFACELAGELSVAATGLPVAGPVIGRALLFAGLVIRGQAPKDLAAMADALLGNLSLLFLPAGVGVIVHLSLIGRDLIAISTALVASTILTIAVTAVVMNWLAPRY
jgi:holin-like protein